MLFLGRTVAMAREGLGMSFGDFAVHLGVSKETLAAIELGEQIPSGDFITRFNEATGCDIHVLAWCFYGRVDLLPTTLQAFAREQLIGWQEHLKEIGVAK